MSGLFRVEFDRTRVALFVAAAFGMSIFAALVTFRVLVLGNPFAERIPENALRGFMGVATVVFVYLGGVTAARYLSSRPALEITPTALISRQSVPTRVVPLIEIAAVVRSRRTIAVVQRSGDSVSIPLLLLPDDAPEAIVEAVRGGLS